MKESQELLSQARASIDTAVELVNAATLEILRQEKLLSQARSILVRIAECGTCDRYTSVGMGSGITPQFVGCRTYRKHESDQWCLACEATALLQEWDKKLEIKRVSVLPVEKA